MSDNAERLHVARKRNNNGLFYESTPVLHNIYYSYIHENSYAMNGKHTKDRRTTIYEPLLFGSIAVAGGMIYLLIKFVF